MDMSIFEILRAKSEDKERPAETLKAHIKNALDRAIELYSLTNSIDVDWKTFRDKEKKEIFFKNLAKATILHDFGKIDYRFQWKLFTKEEKENDTQWNNIKNFFSLQSKEVHFHRHEMLSTIYASFLLKDSNWSNKIMTAILMHHYNDYFTEIPSLPVITRDFEDDIKEYMNFVSKKKEIFEASYEKLLNDISKDFSDCGFINEAIGELSNSANWDNAEELFNSYLDDDLSNFTDFYEPNNRLSDKNLLNLDEDTYKFLVFLGALRRCDYSSSGGVDIESERFPSEILKFDELGQEFKKEFKPFTLWQEEILRDKNSDKIKHLILVAPTGSGKTEFSILWSAKIPRKFIYTLPLRVALNDLFVRFKGNEKIKGYFDKKDVDILHSTSFIEHIRESGGKYLDIERKLTSSKLLSYPLMLTTPDQIFLTSLNYYGSDKILSVYPTSNIVIDEIQTFNPEMAAIIIKTLRVIKFLGGNILVMTATFPPYFEKFLQKDLGFKELDIFEYADNLEIKNYNRKRHLIKVIDKKLFEYKEKGESKEYNVEITSGAEEKIMELLKDKSNALIVVNNVKKAISMYKYVKDNLSNNENGYEIFLLHSRLIEKYKTERIRKIKEKLDKNERVIVVATQIIEASVDFDFDFMITELSTIDSQIQRWGRVYRTRDTDYRNEEPNIAVFAGRLNNNNKLDIDRGTSYIYDKEVLTATRDILKKQQNKLLSYKEEKEMVEETFKKEVNGLTLKEKYEKDIEKALNFLDYFSASKKSDAQRIFRRMAGINAVVPALMKEDKEDWVKKLAEIIENGNDISWKEIREKIKEKTGEDKSKWDLKAEIYNYSVAIPEFAVKKYRWHLSNEFKGFRVLTVKKEQIGNIKEYGLDGWWQELEDDEIDERFY